MHLTRSAFHPGICGSLYKVFLKGGPNAVGIPVEWDESLGSVGQVQSPGCQDAFENGS